MSMETQRILIVEDHEPLLDAIQDILEMEGYKVFTATDGMKALQVMKDTCPDMIISDILMPVMDGFAFFERVSASSEWASIPFIFLTTEAGKKQVQKGMELGARAYITKPFDPQALLRVVHAHLSSADQD